ncbi:hypothetical protein ACJJTC_005507 [Scirpophaga incertulas]
MERVGGCKVYSRFTATRPDGTVMKLRVQDMPPDRLEDVIALQNKHFLEDEPIHRATGLYRNPEAIGEYKAIFLGLAEETPPHIVICCEDTTDEVGVLIGASVMTEATHMVDLTKIPTHTKEVKKLFQMGINTFYTYDACAKHNVDKFFDDVFIVVHTNYRRLGIARELVKTRRVACRDHNVPLAVAWMSALGTQKAGEADGWETVMEASYDEMAKKYDLIFDNAPPTSKLMIAWANKN